MLRREVNMHDTDSDLRDGIWFVVATIHHRIAPDLP